MRAYTAQKLKTENRQQAFWLLAQRRALSKADLSSELGLSAPTASKIINAFLEKGIVREVHTAYEGLGRPPRPVELDARSYFYAGVALEGAYMKVGLIDLAHELVAVRSWPSGTIPLDALIRERAGECVALLAREAGVDPGRIIMGAGLGLPGVCDTQRGVVVTAPLIGVREPLDINESLAALAGALGCPVVFDNDTNMAAVGERLCRGGADDLLFTTLGTGLGSAVIVNGSVVRGRRNRSGEIGYARYRPADALSVTDAGWLESRINIDAACRMCGAGTLEELAAAAPEQKREVSERIAELLAPCLSIVALALDLPLISISGLLPAALREGFFEALNGALARCTPFDTVAVPASSPHVDVIGAAGAAYTELIDHLLTDEARNDSPA
ncbi:MAG TPA: ROK family protein [Clostridia bacterium]|nr:ROK family protein [Clostridia bacterium]